MYIDEYYTKANTWEQEAIQNVPPLRRTNRNESNNKNPNHTRGKQTPEIMMASIARHIKEDHRGSLREWLVALE